MLHGFVLGVESLLDDVVTLHEFGFVKDTGVLLKGITILYHFLYRQSNLTVPAHLLLPVRQDKVVLQLSICVLKRLYVLVLLDQVVFESLYFALEQQHAACRVLVDHCVVFYLFGSFGEVEGGKCLAHVQV